MGSGKASTADGDRSMVVSEAVEWRATMLERMGMQRVGARTTGSSAQCRPGGYRYECALEAMGTVVSIIVHDASLPRAEEGASRAMDDMRRTIALFDRYVPSSPVSSLNASGVLHDAPPEVLSVVEDALKMHRLTGGAFDPTVTPLVDLLESRQEREPSRSEIADILPLIDAGSIRTGRKSVRFLRGNMKLTLDGIAKGYIVDSMARVLHGSGLEEFLINAGGDIRVCTAAASPHSWAIGVHNAAEDDGERTVIRLRNGAVATSGIGSACSPAVAVRTHLIDVAAGAAAKENRYATVIAPSAMLADSLATSAFVLPWPTGVGLVDGQPRCEGFVVRQAGESVGTARWRLLTAPASERH